MLHAIGKRSRHPDLVATRDDGWLDAWIFVCGRLAVKDVFVEGRTLVEGGRHRLRDPIVNRYRAVLKDLMAN
jgi:formimidoylglutamate deiminase